MAITKPVKVPQKNITTTDVVSLDGGIDERGDANADPNSFVYGRNFMVNSRGLGTHRLGLKQFLPDTVETVYEVFPAIYNNKLYYLVADDGKIKYCEAGSNTWVDCGGPNEVTTGPNIVTTFIRVQDAVLILNGVDKLRFINLKDLEMVQYTALPNPTNAPTLTATGITTTGSVKVYYAMNWNSTVGQTEITPILSQTISKQRDMWKTDGTEYVTVARNNTAPAGAKSWNLWVAMAPAGGTIQPSDMLLLAAGIDIATTEFIDNGTLATDLNRGTAPEDNSTDGPIARFGIETDGRPILYGIKGDEHAALIGGYGENALDFSPSNGGYRMVLNQGTNYYPMSFVGFRNGQGIPSLTILFSNTQGLSKQSIAEQQTVSYGNTSFVVWAVTEQNYGAAGVSSPYATTNYNGGLYFHSTDGIMRMDTKVSVQNVLSQMRISDKVEDTVGSIRNAAIDKIVSTAWAGRVYFTIPSRGYDYNNEILIYDISNDQKPKWYSFDIRAQWIGTISPEDEAAFVYICQDNHIYRLDESYAAIDENNDGTISSFPVEARGSLIGLNEAHNSYKAIVQVVFYLTDVIGTVQVGVNYRNESGRMKTKVKTRTVGQYSRSSGGGWSSPDYMFNQNMPTEVLRWGEVAKINNVNQSTKQSIRIPMQMNVIASEMQWFVRSGTDDVTSFVLRSVSYEGENLGVKVDLR